MLPSRWVSSSLGDYWSWFICCPSATIPSAPLHSRKCSGWEISYMVTLSSAGSWQIPLACLAPPCDSVSSLRGWAQSYLPLYPWHRLHLIHLCTWHPASCLRLNFDWVPEVLNTFEIRMKSKYETHYTCISSHHVRIMVLPFTRCATFS